MVVPSYLVNSTGNLHSLLSSVYWHKIRTGRKCKNTNRSLTPFRTVRDQSGSGGLMGAGLDIARFQAMAAADGIVRRLCDLGAARHQLCERYESCIGMVRKEGRPIWRGRASARCANGDDA